MGGWVSEFALTHVDEYIDELLTTDYSCDIALPRIKKRFVRDFFLFVSICDIPTIHFLFIHHFVLFDFPRKFLYFHALPTCSNQGDITR